MPSLVAEQPTGLDETMRGAKNRLSQALATDEAAGADLAVAIESGLLRALSGDEETWVDVAVVSVRDFGDVQDTSTTCPRVRV